VELAADGPWTSAVLDDGRAQHVLRPGQRIEAPPGRYRLTLLDDSGGADLRELELRGTLTTLR
jgi:hypothetical protein